MFRDTILNVLFVEGQELFFKLHVRDIGYNLYSCSPSRNSDSKIYAAINRLGDRQWLIECEDMYGGGNQDLNNVLMVMAGG